MLFPKILLQIPDDKNIEKRLLNQIFWLENVNFREKKNQLKANTSKYLLE